MTGLPITVELMIEAGDWGDEAALRPVIERAVATAAASGAFDVPAGAELSLVLTDDAHVRALNRDYRGKDQATNVLSFPGFEPDEDPGPLLGDIVVARETVLREALDEGRPVEHHVSHLLVHGLLHLFGYDHENDEEADAMERLETAILADLGIPDPYAGSDPASDAATGFRETKAK